MKKSASTFVLLLIIILAITFPEISIVKADDVIYIRADGTVDGTSNIQITGNVYSFTNNITSPIVVERDNIVLDGAGFVLSGYGNGTGIFLTNRSNVTIRNVHIKNFSSGIFLQDSSNSKIIENKVANGGYYGIWLNASSYNRIEGNEVTGNSYWGILCTFTSVQNSIVENCIANNGVSGTVQYLGGICLSPSFDANVTSNYVANNKYGIWLQGCLNCIVSNNNVTYNEWGIQFDEVQNGSLSSNVVTNNSYGIYLARFASGPSSVLRDNRMTNNTYNFGVNNYMSADVDTSNTVNDKPVYCWVNQANRVVPSDAGYVALFNCGNIIIKNLNLSNNMYGIHLSNTTDSTITENNLAGNYHGFYVVGSERNNIAGNNIANNVQGIRFIVSSDNTVYRNNFNHNTIQVRDYYDELTDQWRQWLHVYPSENIWDDGAIGNYWSNYNGPDDNGDGIGDTPYVINDNNQDRHPLMNPLDTTNIILPSPAPMPSPRPIPTAIPTPTASSTITPSPSLETNETPEPPKPTPKVESFPTTLVIASIGFVAIVALGLLVYFKKRGRGRNP